MPEWVSKYWLEWVFGLLIAGLTVIVKRISTRLKREQTENKALREGMRSLLRAKIIDNCERGLLDGWCGARLRDTIADLYESYHALGGNGTVTSLVEQAMRLPAIDPEKGEKHD